MKKGIQKWSVFLGKSMLWSLLLYVALMLAVNWDDIHNAFTGRNKITIVADTTTASQNTSAQVPATITHHASSFKKVITLFSGISKAATAL